MFCLPPDNTDVEESSALQTFSMSGDSTSDDIDIPSVFMLKKYADRLRQLLASAGEEVFVLLTWIRKEGVGSEGEREGSSDDQSNGSLYDSGHGEQTEGETELEQNHKSLQNHRSSSEKSSH